MSKNFLITGACRGIGRGLSRLLLQKGHRVFLLDNDEIEIAHMRTQVPEWLEPSELNDINVTKESSDQQQQQNQKQKQKQYQIFRADLSSKSDIDLAATTAQTFFHGHLDVLINNAAYTSGVIHDHKIDSDTFLENWHQSLTVNLTGSMLLTRASLPMLRKSPNFSSSSSSSSTAKRPHGGSVIFISSTRAYQSEANSEAYATTKAGLLGLSQSLACSLAADNITSNVILPGWINVAHECRQGDTSGQTWADNLTPEDHRWHFTGRVGKVEDVLRAVEYFVGDGDGDSFVTGQECIVDGGVSRRMVYPE